MLYVGEVGPQIYRFNLCLVMQFVFAISIIIISICRFQSEGCSGQERFTSNQASIHLFKRNNNNKLFQQKRTFDIFQTDIYLL